MKKHSIAYLWNHIQKSANYGLSPIPIKANKSLQLLILMWAEEEYIYWLALAETIVFSFVNMNTKCRGNIYYCVWLHTGYVYLKYFLLNIKLNYSFINNFTSSRWSAYVLW